MDRIDFDADAVSALSMHKTERRDWTLPRKEGPLRFRVLRPDGSVSDSWKVHSKRDDAYVFSREYNEHVSFHGSDVVQITQPDPPKFGVHRRAVARWTPGNLSLPDGSSVVPDYQLIFPPWMGGWEITEPEALPRRDDLLIVGHREKATVVGFFLLDAGVTLNFSVPSLKLGELPKGSQHIFHVMAWRTSVERTQKLKENIEAYLPAIAGHNAEFGVSPGRYRVSLYGGKAPQWGMTGPIDYEEPS